MKNSENGLTSISVLAVTVLLVFITAGLAVNIQHLLKLNQLDLHSQKAKNELINNLIFDSFQEKPEMNEGLICNENFNQVGLASLNAEICFITKEGNFPLINYTDLFSTLAECSGKLEINRKFTNTLLSEKTCAEEIKILSKDYANTNNIKFISELTLNSSITKPINISSTGSITFLENVQVLHDSVIIAGGDISIPTIEIKGSTKLTLLSVTGKIEVLSSSSPVKLSAFSTREISLAANITNENSAAHLPIKSRLTVSLGLKNKS